jgi:hypothetical protein
MKTSIVCKGARVSFAEFTGERVYMAPFLKSEGLPAHLARWQRTVDAMLRGIEPAGKCFLMIDQADVRRGDFHRRPGLHVDNYWNPGTVDHGGPPGPSGPGHNPQPAPGPGHGGQRASRARELVVIASDALGCQALTGQWSGETDGHGDCRHVKRDRLRVVPMLPGVAWVGETGSLLHESLPLARDAQRTVVRLNVPMRAA